MLAGGASRRMGTDKAALHWQGRPLLDHMLGLARLAGVTELAVAGPHAPADVVRLDDVVAQRGPIGGLLAVLRWRPRVLVLACDMPQLTPDLLRFLWQRASAFAGGTLPAGQPLCAVYTRELLPWLQAVIAAPSSPSLAAALADAPRLELSADELARHGFGAELFANLNTPADFAAATAGLDSISGRTRSRGSRSQRRCF
ncbi:MAG TPA: molybdenum cofactor guanylyltransferase [Terriglobales bacterium]|nr:molybdenum cofactor guanylyltransferase [Terriglobales bacterium]